MNKSFIGVTFFGLIALFSLFGNPTKVYAQNPTASNYFVPVIFYASDSPVPSQQVIDSINKATVSIKDWYRQKAGGNIEFASAKLYRGTATAEFYQTHDVGNCGSGFMFWCNINLELLDHEINQAAVGQTDTGFGWSNRIPIIFITGLANPDTLPLGGRNFGYGMGWYLPNFGGRAIFSQFVLDSLSGNFETCKNVWRTYGYTDSILLSVTCSEKAMLGVTSHEMGHTMTLKHTSDDAVYISNLDPECELYSNLMCPGGGFPKGPWSWPEAQFNSSQKSIMKSHGYLDPLPYATSGNFCFANSSDPSQWCTARGQDSTLPMNLPLPLEVDSVSPRITTPISVNWPLATFRSQICIANVGCQPFSGSGTKLYKDWTVASLYEYTAHVDISNDNGAHWYGWEHKNSFGKDCYGPATCTLRLSWAAPDYHINIPVFGAPIIKTHPLASYTFPAVPTLTTYLGNTYFNDLDNFGSAHNIATHSGTTPACISAPSAPRSLSSSLSGSAGSQSVNLTWTAPSGWGNECGLSARHSYRVYLGSTNSPQNAYFEPTATNQTISGLYPGSTIYWRIKSRNAAGVYSDFSSVSQFTAAPIPIPTPTPTPTPTPPIVPGIPAVITSPPQMNCASGVVSGKFSWTAAVPAGGATIDSQKFDLSTGSSMVLGTYGAFNIGSSVTTKDFSSLPADSQLYWRIESHMTNGTTLYSNVGSFKSPVCLPDADADGFADSREVFMGTDPNKACGVDAWPPDIDNDGAVSILDITKVSNAFGSKTGEAKYNKRYDMDADGQITILDITIINKYFTNKC